MPVCVSLQIKVNREINILSLSLSLFLARKLSRHAINMHLPQLVGKLMDPANFPTWWVAFNLFHGYRIPYAGAPMRQ